MERRFESVSGRKENGVHLTCGDPIHRKTPVVLVNRLSIGDWLKCTGNEYGRTGTQILHIV